MRQGGNFWLVISPFLRSISYFITIIEVNSSISKSLFLININHTFVFQENCSVFMLAAVSLQLEIVLVVSSTLCPCTHIPGADPSFPGCACSQTGTCDEEGLQCNCDAMDGDKAVDQGSVTDKVSYISLRQLFSHPDIQPAINLSIH